MNRKLYKLMNWPKIEAIVYAEEPDPFKMLGVRQSGTNILFQAFLPGVEKADVKILQGKEEKSYPMELADEAGFFAALIPGRVSSVQYEYEILRNGKKIRMKDAYAYSGYEIKGAEAKKILAGEHHALQDVLGAKLMTVKGDEGVRFSVWAPGAVSVSVAGSFNDFTPGLHQMKFDHDTGLYELFIPGVKEGDTYVYHVKANGGRETVKLDPFSKRIDLSENVSVVTGDGSYTFADEGYLKKRGEYKKGTKPLSIYELYPGNFRRGKNASGEISYRELAETLPKYLSETGYTHVNLMPLAEYLSDESLGYKTTSFFAPTARYGTPDDLKCFVDACHKNDIGVIMDIRLSDFDKDELGLACYDGSALYEYADPGLSSHPDGDRLLFDFGRGRVRDFLISSVLFWISEYHLDGLKFDNLSAMLYLNYGKEGWNPRYNIYGGSENLEAISLIKECNRAISASIKDVFTIADEVTGFPYVTTEPEEGLGFDYKLNNGFVTEYLRFICDDAHFRKSSFNRLSDSMAYQYTERFISALSHHEFINGYPSMLSRMVGDEAQQFANLRLSYAFLYAHPGRKMIFEGQEFGTAEPFSFDRPYDFGVTSRAHHKGIRNLCRELNKLYQSNSAFYEKDDAEDGFEWINAMPNDSCILSFLRKGKGEAVLCVFNFSEEEQSFSVGTPYAGKYKELLNTDDKDFGGKGTGLITRQKAVTEIPADGRPYSLNLKLAPLSGTILKYVPFTETEKHKIAKKKEAAEAKTKAAQYAEEAHLAEEEAQLAKEEMERVKERMKDALSRAQKAHEKENAELDRAKRALAESQ